MKRRAVPNVLSIAGSDPSGGAGIQADLRTLAAIGVFGTAAPVVLTAQNTTGVFAVHAVPAEFVRRQLDAVFSDVDVAAVKVGMLGTPKIVRAVAGALRAHRPRFVVVDPVLRASTGGRLSQRHLARALEDELAPLATVVTPNAAEAGALLGWRRAPHDLESAGRAAAELVARGWRAALVTGGHMDDVRRSVDVLAAGSRTHQSSVPRVAGTAHGTGCTLSSAIAAYLALGRGLRPACAEAQRFVARAIARSGALRAGRGTPPANQLGGVET